MAVTVKFLVRLTVKGENGVSLYKIASEGKTLPEDVGRALSFALRLRNKNNGASQTHIPKKVAISVKLGTFRYGPPRYIL
jgi:hypothetical protein